MGFISGLNLFGAGLGFVIGALGFVIVRYWIRPVSAYGRIKRQVAAAVDGHLVHLAAEPRDGQWKSSAKENRRQLRRLATELSDVFNHDLPSWYRIRLRAREELPAEAGAALMKLSNISDAEPALNRAAQVRELLRLGG